MKIFLLLVAKKIQKSFLNHTKTEAKLFCFFAFMALASGDFYAQTSSNLSNKEKGVIRYEAELESQTIGTVILINNIAEITADKLDINSIWVVNPEYPNIPFGDIAVKDGVSIVNLSQVPNGKYFILGKKDNIIVAYRTVK